MIDLARPHGAAAAGGGGTGESRTRGRGPGAGGSSGAGGGARDGDSGENGAGVLTEALVRAGGGTVRAVVLYGSHHTGMAGEHSAVDLVAVVEDYRRFYAALGDAGELPRPAWLMAAAAGVLAPNVIAFAPEGERGRIAKVVVYDERHFARALGPHARDLFLIGRLIQDVHVVWTADGRVRARVESLLEQALSGVLDWSAPYLPETFDAESLGRRLLEVLYGAELRPEAGDRSDRIFEAQREHFRARLAPVLERAAEAGVVERVEGTAPAPGAVAEGDPAPSGAAAEAAVGTRYRLVRRPGRWERLRSRLWFERSKWRATARWLKHVITFANWLPYVVRKVERHTGQPIELTPLERRWPLVFLWPKAIRVLRAQARRERSP